MTRLYRVSWSDKDHGTCLEWHKTLPDARQAATKREYSLVQVVDIPTESRGSLCQWLNTHVTTDNG